MSRGFLGMFRKRVDCDEVRKRASDYLESDLSEGEREWIRQHLALCLNCNSFMDTLRSTISMLGELPSKAIPSGLKQKLLRISSGRDSDKE